MYKCIKSMVKALLVLAAFAGVAYLVYKFLSKKDEFDEFDDGFDLDSDYDSADNIVDKVKSKIKAVSPF